MKHPVSAIFWFALVAFGFMLGLIVHSQFAATNTVTVSAWPHGYHADYKLLTVDASNSPMEVSVGQELGFHRTGVAWPECRKITHLLFQSFTSIGHRVEIYYNDDACGSASR